MLEIREGRERKFGAQDFYFNGKRSKGTCMLRMKNGRWELISAKGGVNRLLLRTPIEELRTQFTSLYLDIEGRCHPWIDHLQVDFEAKGPFRVELRGWNSYQEWQEPFTAGQYLDQIENVAKHFRRSGVRIKTYEDTEAWDVSFSFRNANRITLLEEMRWRSRAVNEVLGLALDQANAELHIDSLTAHFHFPTEVRAACVQYLSYFTQFLQDLGMNATSELRQSAHRVLFIVTPASRKLALARIEEALANYLHLPVATEPFRGLPNNTEVAVAQLAANVNHLRSQLEASRAVLDASLQSFANPKFRQIKQEAALETLDRRGESSDVEPLIGEIVSVTKFRFKGIEIDLPKLLRKLKRVWRR